MKRVLLLAIAGAVVLAGCADNSNDGDDTNDPTPAPAMSNEQAQALLSQATASMPDQYGFQFAVTRNGNELMAADGTLDNATGANYVSLRGSAAMFGGMRALADGVSIYTSQDGAVYELAGLAIVQGAAADELDGLVPTMLFTPDALLEQIDGLRVTQARATTWKGQPATEISYTVSEANQTMTGKAVILQSPARVAHVEGTLPPEAGMMAGASMSVDILYDDDVPAVPAAPLRLAELAYDIDASGDSETWTFHGDGIPLSDLSVRVQDASQGGDVAQAPAVLELALVDETASAEGVTLTFDDKDADGLLSAGDTLTLTAGPDATIEPRALLYDSVLQKHVTGDFTVVMMAMMGGF